MRHPIPFLALGATLCLLVGAVHAQEVTESRPVDARVVRVKLDGTIDLRLRQGSVAALTITGDQRAIARVSTVQSGDLIELDNPGSRRAPLRAELVLPQLREVVSEGLGTAEVSGFSGEDIQITLEGAGSMKVVCDYRHLKANLGGIGSMHLWVSDNDSVNLDLGGAGYVTLGGRSKLLKASLGGLGGLNAQQFQAESVDIDLSGLGNATVHARSNAKLSLSGLGSVTVYGKPQHRDVSVDGLGKVSWK
jgi:hypothetical protein